MRGMSRLIVLACSFILPAFFAGPYAQAQTADVRLSEREICVHLLNRLAFGPRPGQVERLQRMGWKRWVEQQLHGAAPPSDAGRVIAKRGANKPRASPADLLVEHPWLVRRFRRVYPLISMGMEQALDRYRPPYRNQPPKFLDKLSRAKLRLGTQQELVSAVFERAVFSRFQLREVLVDFWRNHFNLDLRKQRVVYLAAHHEQQVIRRHLVGQFEQMLLASARHPAMLIYLDNALSQKPPTAAERRAAQGRRGQGLALQRGLNENYARELLELYTLGVDNGYTQRDVMETARVLTGWSVPFGENHSGFGFLFRKQRHDEGPKTIMGWRFPAGGGQAEGKRLIRLLARDPRTARLIALKLCRYLVHDRPPEALVKRVTAAYLASGGRLLAVYRAILFSPEFVSRRHSRAKFKTPFEFTVSALRAMGVDQVDDPLPVQRVLDQMGQPLYRFDDPTGYSDAARDWMDPGALAHRWNFARRLVAGRVSGLRLPRGEFARLAKLPPAKLVEHLRRQICPSGIGPRTRRALALLLRDPAARARLPQRIAALLLGSPGFQQQ